MDMEIQQGRGIIPRRLRDDKTQTESAIRRKERARIGI
jgi:hypothetical protein